MCPNEDTESDSDKSEKCEETFSLWSAHYKLVHRNWKSNKSEESMSDDELSIYLRTSVGRLNANPLEIWKDYKIQFPKLYKIAFRYLTMVDAVPSERSFSQAAQILNQQRNRLKGKRLNKILFLQSIDKKYWDF